MEPELSVVNSEQRQWFSRKWLRPALIGVVFVIVNIAIYMVLRSDTGRHWLRGLGGYAYLGAFIVMLIANMTVVVPVPWPAILLPIAAQVDSVLLVVLAATLGSVLGESVAYFIGQSGQNAITETRFYIWVHRHMRHPGRAWLLLFVLATPPNPLFDMAGLIAGAVGLPYWMFFTAVFCGRALRLWVFVVVGGQFVPAISGAVVL